VEDEVVVEVEVEEEEDALEWGGYRHVEQQQPTDDTDDNNGNDGIYS
jgi:hypothetical protein